MVSFSNVSKRYGDQVVLEDVSFEIQTGEFVFLVGRSGAGKTTVMRMLTYQSIADAGEIRVNDLVLHKLRRRDIQSLRRNVGVIYQDYKLLSERTVAENIALGLEIIGKSKEEIRSRVHDLLGLVQLSEKGELFPSQLSGGEAQRVCIARALATAPRLLFADEPTGNLDDTTAFSIVKLLAKINELGTTIIMATHNMSLVDRLQKRVIALKDGRVVQVQAHGEDETLTQDLLEPQAEPRKKGKKEGNTGRKAIQSETKQPAPQSQETEQKKEEKESS